MGCEKLDDLVLDLLTSHSFYLFTRLFIYLFIYLFYSHNFEQHSNHFTRFLLLSLKQLELLW